MKQIEIGESVGCGAAQSALGVLTGTKPVEVTVVNNATVTAPAPQLARADRPSSHSTVVGGGALVGAGVGTAVGFVVQQVAD